MRKPRIVSEGPEVGLEQPVAPAGKPRRLHAAVTWAGVGFMTGAAFWHLVGFWTFVSEVVLDRSTSAHAAAVTTAQKRPAAGAPPVVVVDTGRCTMLSLDRHSKLTSGEPCPATSLALRFIPGTATRENLAVSTGPQLQAVDYRAD